MGHNLTNTQPLNTLPSEEERGVIRATLDRIASVWTGYAATEVARLGPTGDLEYSRLFG